MFGRVCEVAASSLPVLAHLSWVYEGCRLASPAPPVVRLQLKGEDKAGYTVTVNGSPVAGGSSLFSALLLLDLEILRLPLFFPPPLPGFHAAWVARGKEAFILAGEGGCGKSSLCYLLVLHGFAYGSDEATAFSPDGGLLPLPRRIMLKGDNPLIPRLALKQDDRNLLAGFDGRFYVLPEDFCLAPPGFYDLSFVFLKYQGDLAMIKVTPVRTLDALRSLLGLAFRLKTVTPSLFALLVKSLGPGRALVLEYGSLDQALAFLLELADGKVLASA
jgi:hypothetical protein